MPRPRLTAIRIALALAAAFSCARVMGCSSLEFLETRTVDYRLLQRGPQPASDDVVVVAIDDASLESVGRWPWPRGTMADLLRRVMEAEPAVVGFDIVQSEETAVTPIVAALEQRMAELDDDGRIAVREALADWSAGDAELARAIAGAGRVVLGYFYDFDDQAFDDGIEGGTEYNLVRRSANGRGERHIPRASAARGNLPILNSAARATGFFNVIPDADGAIRRLPLVIRYHDGFMMPLSLAMLQVYWGGSAAMIRLADFGVDSVEIGPRSIPVSEDGQILLNYRGPRRSFRHVSAADVLAGSVDSSALAGKLVLVGVTADAVADIRVTPFDGVMPGVEVHATALDNILRESYLLQPNWVLLVEIGLTFASIVLLGVFLRFARGLYAAAGVAALILGYLTFSQWLFVSAGVPLGLIYPVVAIGVSYVVVALYHYRTESREKRKIRDAFGLYLNPELARLVSEAPEVLKLGGDKRVLTVLFSDIRDFTSISERLPAEALVDLLNVYLGEMTDVVFDHDGTLDKYVGDAIMAIWGAPVPQDHHAAHACHAALDMLERLAPLNERFAARGWPRLRVGIGIHTGGMVVGNMGSARRLSYTVIGDNVNIGARLETLTKTYGVPIIASEETVDAARGAVVARELDVVTVKGKARSTRIFQVLARGTDGEAWAPLVEAFAAALGSFRDGQYDAAARAFEAIVLRYPDDRPAQLYLERCRELLRAKPPPALESSPPAVSA